MAVSGCYGYEFCLCDGLSRVFPEERPVCEGALSVTALRGETVSFQAAYRAPGPGLGSLRVEVDSPLGKRVRLRAVEPVPCGYPGEAEWDDGNYERLRPGMFPDVLRDLEEGNRLPEGIGQWRALWVDIEPGEETGRFPVVLRFSDRSGVVGELEAWVELLEAALPPQRLLHTQWLHADCLADYYGLEPWSEEHWQVVGEFIGLMAKRGINMVLTPLFTPPLDTAVGGERTTVQLVQVFREKGGWRFGFERLKRWVELCREKGIEWIEFSHLFTQWGAKAAPKVVAMLEDGREEKVFGWETPAVGGEYTAFLKEFLPQLTKKLREWGIQDRCCFHISDEPSGEQLGDYLAARDSVKGLLAGFRCMDALSSYEFYRRGVVETPVVATNHIEPFLENQVEGLWAYYCVSQHEKVSNRYFAMPLARCRALGVQLFRFGIAGFLHWGFNFYNSAFSTRHINPYAETDAGGKFPGGDPFVVYPGPGGVPEESMRLMVLNQALGDLRALEGLAAVAGRDYVLKLMEEGLAEPITFSCYPREKGYYLRLRERVNRELARRG